MFVSTGWRAAPPPQLALAVIGAVLLHAAVLGGRLPTLSMNGERAPATTVTVRAIPTAAQPPVPSRFDAAVEPVAAAAGKQAPQPSAPAPALPNGPAGDAGSRAGGPSPAAGGPADAAIASTRRAERGDNPPPLAQPQSQVRSAEDVQGAGAAMPGPASVAPSPGHRADKAAGAVALPPAPEYLAGGQLDPGPRPLDDIEPHYPESANSREGTVVLRLLVSATGALDNVAVVSADPVGVFESSAVEAFAKARFAPGRVLGVAVKSQITVEVHFMPINRGSRISGRGY